MILRYEWARDGAPIGRETVEWTRVEGGWSVACERDWDKRSAERALLSTDWEVLELELAGEPGKEPRARYRWIGDAWAGGAEPGGWPMTRGMQPVTVSTSLLDAMLRRSALAPNSQKRIEALRIDLQDLSVRQTHFMIDRIDGARYRCVDEDGDSAEISISTDGHPSEIRFGPLVRKRQSGTT